VSIVMLGSGKKDSQKVIRLEGEERGVAPL